MEPIRKVMGPRTGVDGAAPLHALAPVARREDRDEDGQPKKRRPPAPAPEQRRDAPPHRGDDGRLHVDLRA